METLKYEDLKGKSIEYLEVKLEELYGEDEAYELKRDYITGLVLNAVQKEEHDRYIETSKERRISTVSSGRIIVYEIDEKWDSGRVYNNDAKRRVIEVMTYKGDRVTVPYDAVQWIKNKDLPAGIRQKLEQSNGLRRESGRL